MAKIGAQLPHYLPDFPYFYRAAGSELFLVADHLSFRKQSPIVRARLDGQHRNFFLSIPCVHQPEPHPALREVRLAETGEWRRKHARTLISRFSGFPFFEYYFPELKNIYERDHTFLVDFLKDILNWQMGIIFPHKKIVFSSDEGINTNHQLREWFNRTQHPELLIYPEESPYYKQNFPEFPKRELLLPENTSWPPVYEQSLPFLFLLFLKGPESAAYLAPP
jgi:hypothetical protein